MFCFTHEPNLIFLTDVEGSGIPRRFECLLAHYWPGPLPQPCFHPSCGLGHTAALLRGSSGISHEPRPGGDIQSILGVYCPPAKTVKLSGIIVPFCYVHEEALSKDIDQVPNDLMAQQVELIWFAAGKLDHSY